MLNQDFPENDGSHWVMIYRLDDDDIIYFDSFGGQIPKPIQGKVNHINRQDLQLFMASSCGYWCLYMIDKLLEGQDFYQVLFSFEQDGSKKNESKLQRHFNKGGQSPP